MVQRKRIRLGTVRLQVRFLALLSGLGIQCCRELWCRSQVQLGSELLWLWRRPAATAPIRPLAWESPYVMGEAQRKKERKEEKSDERDFPSGLIVAPLQPRFSPWSGN